MTQIKSRLTHVLIPGLLAGFAGLAIAEDHADPSQQAAAATQTPPAVSAADKAAAQPLVLPLQQLFSAIRQNDCEKAEALLKQGVNPNQFDSFGYTPLTVAALDKHVQCMKSLLAHGADVNLAGAGGWNPLIGAAMNGSRAEVLDVLLDKGANINARNQWGCTALYYAVGYGALPTVDHLLKRGAALPGTSGECLTPLRLAELRAYPAVVERLKQAEKAGTGAPAQAASHQRTDLQASDRKTADRQE